MSATKEWLLLTAERDLDHLCAEGDRLRTVNAELLAALVQCEAALRTYWVEIGDDGNAALDAARTAIAKVRTSDADGFGLMPGGRE